MSHTFEYINLTNDKSIGRWVTYYSSGDAECPFCGKPMDYEKYQSGQGQQGNDEYCGHFVCQKCSVGTAPTEISMHEYFSDDQW